MVIYSQGKAILPIKFRIPVWPRYLAPLEAPKIPQLVLTRSDKEEKWTPIPIPPDCFVWTEEDKRPCQKYPGNNVIVGITGPLGTIRQAVAGDFSICMGDKTWTHECHWPNFAPETSRDFHDDLVYERFTQMVHGVTSGFEKRLRLSGKGYRAWTERSRKLILKCGYSHLVEFGMPPGTLIETQEMTDDLGQLIRIRAIDYVLANWVAEKVRRRRPMDKAGHGCRYDGYPITKKARKK